MYTGTLMQDIAAQVDSAERKVLIASLELARTALADTMVTRNGENAPDMPQKVSAYHDFANLQRELEECEEKERLADRKAKSQAVALFGLAYCEAIRCGRQGKRWLELR